MRSMISSSFVGRLLAGQPQSERTSINDSEAGQGIQETQSRCMPVFATAGVASGLMLAMGTVDAVIFSVYELNQAAVGTILVLETVGLGLSTLGAWAVSTNYSSNPKQSAAKYIVDYGSVCSGSKDVIEGVPAFPDRDILRSSDDELSPADVAAAEEAGSDSDEGVFRFDK